MVMKKRVENLFVNPSLSDLSTTPFFVMPVSLLSLIAYLQKNGISSDLLDFNVLKKKEAVRCDTELISIFESRLREQKPCMVGVSVMVAGQLRLTREIMKSVKRVFPETVTVVGGAHASEFPREILQHCPEIDFVVMGEGELQALACAQYAQRKELPQEWPDGIAYRSDGQIRIRPKTFFLESLDTLPIPAYDIVGFENYLHDTTRWHNPYQIDLGVRVPVITSRGCPNRCNFCTVSQCMGFKYRPMSPLNVADMIQRLYEQHDVRCFAIYDANFAQDPQRVIQICGEIDKRNLNILLDLPTGLPINETLNEMLEALVSVGLFRTCISVESGDTVIRNNVMRKEVEQEDIFRVVEAIRRYPQIFLLTDFVMGMPEDTGESLEASCRLIENLDTDDITLSLATPYPGTDLYRQCVRDNLFYNVERENLWMEEWYNHNYTGRFVIKPYTLDMETLSEYRDRILSLRARKISSYHARMKTIFGVESKYRRV